MARGTHSHSATRRHLSSNGRKCSAVTPEVPAPAPYGDEEFAQRLDIVSSSACGTASVGLGGRFVGSVKAMTVSRGPGDNSTP